jgi:prepilin-type N-terminal cleavage/methylation domain-containing protein
MCNRQKRTRSGFTLVELLVVMSVIAILLTLLVPTLGPIRVQANVTRANALINGMKMGLEQYKQVYGRYAPDRGVGLDSDLDKSAECIVYYLSGGSISYDPGPPVSPANYPWQNSTLFGDSTTEGTGRRSWTIFYTFNETALVSNDGDNIPEVIDPWQTRFIYNSGPTSDGAYNQMADARHNLRKFDLFSAGPDQQYTTMDDNVCNWKDSRGYQYYNESTMKTH